MDIDPFPGPLQSFGLPNRYLAQIALIVAAAILLLLVAQLH